MKNITPYRVPFLVMIFLTIVYKGFSQSDSNSLQAENIKSIVELYIEDVVNKQKLELLPQIFSKDYVFHEMNGKDSHHMKNNTLEPFLIRLFKAFPDLHYVIENIITEGDKVAIGCTAKGTHKDIFLGVPASGNKIMYKEIFIFRIEKRKIIEGWGVVDIAGVKEQLLKK